MATVIFLDLKLHDIPNTIASAIRNIQGMPIKMLTLHTAGGSEMMKRASEAQHEAFPDAILLGVTVLTSMNQASLREIGCEYSLETQVTQLGQLAIDSGIQGLVCSPIELRPLRTLLGRNPVLVTPGIRPTGSASDDQKRIMTPAPGSSSRQLIYRCWTTYFECTQQAPCSSRDYQGTFRSISTSTQRSHLPYDAKKMQQYFFVQERENACRAKS